jgi:ADP-ribose pyrophosphatase
MIQPWKKTGSKLIGDFRIFTLRSDRSISPRTGKEHDFFVLDCPGWVNVIAITPDQNLVMVDQFRHGSNTVELEIPGGVMDAGETDPVATGVRELREETGYEGENARVLGKILANPAILTNTCYTVLIENCRLKHELKLDCGEDLATRLVPVADMPRLVAEGKIQHSLVVVALYHFDLWRRGLKKI